MKRMKQGYDSRLDESLGMRNRGLHRQSFKDRRDESKGMEKSQGKRAYSSVSTMDREDKMRHEAAMKAAHHKFMASHYRKKLHKK